MTETAHLWNHEEVQLREYQEEIYQRAVKEDLLVILATSLGKTFIGAKLISHILVKKTEIPFI